MYGTVPVNYALFVQCIAWACTVRRGLCTVFVRCSVRSFMVLYGAVLAVLGVSVGLCVVRCLYGAGSVQTYGAPPLCTLTYSAKRSLALCVTCALAAS
jgi:hypothetical protein